MTVLSVLHYPEFANLLKQFSIKTFFAPSAPLCVILFFSSHGLFPCSAPLQRWCALLQSLLLNLDENITEPDEKTNPVQLSVIVFSGTTRHFSFYSSRPVLLPKTHFRDME